MRFNDARTWGCEIEFLGNKAAVVREMRANGLACVDNGYTHNTMSTWKMVSDSSAEWELVSPPLAGEEGWRQLKIACNALAAAGVTINRTCGFHVHHVARDLPQTAIRNFIKLYCRYEGVIDTLVSPSRRNSENQYCRSLRSRLANDADYSRLDHAANLYNFNGTRYMKVNLESMGRQGTIEIRHHQGTIDYQKIKAWIVFTQGLLNHAVDKRVGNTCNASWEQLKITMGAVGVQFADDTSRNAITYLNARYRRFTRNVPGMSSRTVIEANHAPMSEPTARRTPRLRVTRSARLAAAVAGPSMFEPTIVETTVEEEQEQAIANDRANEAANPGDFVCAVCGFVEPACSCGNVAADLLLSPYEAHPQYTAIEDASLGTCTCMDCREARRRAVRRAGIVITPPATAVRLSPPTELPRSEEIAMEFDRDSVDAHLP